MKSDNQKNTACIVCGNRKLDIFKKVGKFTYYRCLKCGGVFADPIRSQNFYLGTKTYLDNAKDYLSIINPEGQRWMIEQFERLYFDITKKTHKGSFFEVGAGVGYLTLFALARGWEACGIETSADAVKFANEYFRVDIEQSIVEDYKTKKDFDAVVMVEVLEHFLSPVDAVKAIKRIAKKKGFIFGTTPNTDSDHWKKGEQNIYVPEDHIFLFNPKSLKTFAKKAGIKKLVIEPFGSGDKHDSNLIYAGIL